MTDIIAAAAPTASPTFEEVNNAFKAFNACCDEVDRAKALLESRIGCRDKELWDAAHTRYIAAIREKQGARDRYRDLCRQRATVQARADLQQLAAD